MLELVEGIEAMTVDMEKLRCNHRALKIQCTKEQRGKYKAIMLLRFKMQLMKWFGRWRYVMGQKRKKEHMIEALSPKHGSESEMNPALSISELQLQDFQLCWQ